MPDGYTAVSTEPGDIELSNVGVTGGVCHDTSVVGPDEFENSGDDTPLSSTKKTFVNIFISFVGAGILGLPYAFKKSGLLLGSVFMVVVALLSWRAMLLLIYCKRRLEQDKLKIKTYGDLAKIAYGRIGQFIVDSSIVITQAGFCCAYIIFISENLSSLLDVSGLVIVGVCMPPLILLALVRSLTSLVPFSLLADAANIFGISAILGMDVRHIISSSEKSNLDAAVFRSLPFLFGVLIYCYEGVGLVIPLENAMQDRSKFGPLLTVAMVVITTLFLGFGMIGYSAFGDETDDIITLNLPHSTLTALLKVSLCIGLFFTHPIMLFPVIETLEPKLFSADLPKAVRHRNGNFLRGAVVLVTGLVAIMVPEFGLFISLIGSSCCALLAFILPALFHLKIFGGMEGLGWVACCIDVFLIVFGVLGALFGTGDTLMELLYIYATPTTPYSDTDLMNQYQPEVDKEVPLLHDDSGF